MKPITELYNKHKGEDIYVIGSGTTLDYIDFSFFDNKTTIGINQVFRHINCTYTVMTHGDTGQECIDAGHTLVCSEYRRACEADKNLFKGEYYMFRHLTNQHQHIELTVLDENNMLPVSCSTVTPAVSLAYKMGASTIILCGCDCGYLDGRSNFKDYYYHSINVEVTSIVPNIQHSEPQLYKLVTELRNRNINIYSLNPFINPHLEGHKYQHRVKFGDRQYEDCYVTKK